MQNESYEARSARLAERLRQVGPEELRDFLERERGELIESERPFSDYMRRKLREKGVLQQNVFLAADLSENYGYKLIAEEKHTRQRDTVLRLCLAARFQLEEVQEALVLYGMAPLYGRFARDAVLIAAIQQEIFDLQALNRLLIACGQAPLVQDYE
ncbi:MAG: hypothetical protein J5967_07440 [Oscillospiraceae bacterium]|nr:hypothetical protein [Oscillospiraceae bacterium]